MHNLLKTSKKIRSKIFPIINFPYLCLPNKWGVALYCFDRHNFLSFGVIKA